MNLEQQRIAIIESLNEKLEKAVAKTERDRECSDKLIEIERSLALRSENHLQGIIAAKACEIGQLQCQCDDLRAKLAAAEKEQLEREQTLVNAFALERSKVEQLELENAELRVKLAAAEKERDSALENL